MASSSHPTSSLIVCYTFWQLRIVHGIIQHLILAIFVVYKEWVSLTIVSAWLLVLWTSLLFWQQYIISLSSDQCAYCKLLWLQGLDVMHRLGRWEMGLPFDHLDENQMSRVRFFLNNDPVVILGIRPPLLFYALMFCLVSTFRRRRG
jgi:hypothetical protein